jgi:L-lactate dehydrogenase complex protein LldG
VLKFKDRLRQFKIMMERAQAQIITTEIIDLPRILACLLVEKNIKNILYTNGNEEIKTIVASISHRNFEINFQTYQEDIEKFKDDLFNFDAALTSTYSGIAETGTVVLCPNDDEPRLMSMIPPTHIALLSESKIVNSLSELIMEKC